ncbi:metallophosphoesterase [Roseovarius sp. LXJ103]|uniref:metallophosphoesterase n=1 Tax=Roseovarius carneus TaxID=2853164 RepID=UPI000D60B94F|nr:metallophosphoesterase [Roseovarius carneus]MBZ8119898.1 metallophosphoesterase [Roseovarius carneus]PWE34509.1 phosphodiesterase [Pelagicola sp. LXJ1103]
MKLVHISDLHLTLPGERMGGVDPHQRFAQALAHVLAHHSDATRIIITGDLTHWGEPGAYAALRDVLTDLPCPVRLLIGNHDDRAAFLSAFPDHPKDAHGFINYAETVDTIRLIYLDTTAPRTHAGHFCAVRRDWLAAELESHDRTRLFVHHNIMPIALPATDKIALVPRDRTPLADLLDQYRDRIDYVHFGHVHTPVHGTYCDIPFASVRSTVNQSLPDFSERDLLQSAPMAPSYSVILADATGTLIHDIPFAWDGPVFTAGTDWEEWAKPLVVE